MGDGVVEIGEHMVFTREVRECTDGAEQPNVFGSGALEQDLSLIHI